MIQLMDFDFQILYRQGCKHQDADALSRQSWDNPRSDEVLFGGDVGIAPHIEEKDTEEEVKKEAKKEEETEAGSKRPVIG